MRRVLKFLAIALLALVLTGAALVLLLTDAAPRRPERAVVSPGDVERAVALLRQHDPREVSGPQTRSATLGERDLDLLVHYVARRFWVTDAGAAIDGGVVRLRTGVPALAGRWFNVELGLREQGQWPVLDSVWVGRVPLPSGLVLALARRLARGRGMDIDRVLALDIFQGLRIGAHELTVAYRVAPDTLSRVRAALAVPGDGERLRAYATRLAQLTLASPRSEVPLGELMAPLFALAAERSAAPGADPVAENRAVLIALTFLANQRPLGEWFPAAYTWPVPRPVLVVLRQRHDTAQHFLISALVAVQADSPLADAVGLWKELADTAPGGSGFSFNDLAADRAGTRFGELAAHEPHALQSTLAAAPPESAYVPDIADLPEGLAASEVQRRFGGVEGEGFRRMREDIEARVDRLALHRR
jgi:hypothetical protein